jgi:hypothetical protein
MKRIDIGAVVVRLVGYSREGCVLVVDHAVEAIDGSSDQPTRSGVGVTSGQEHQAEDQGPILDGAVCRPAVMRRRRRQALRGRGRARW